MSNVSIYNSIFALKGLHSSHQLYDILDSNFTLSANLKEIYNEFDTATYDNKIANAKNRMMVSYNAAELFLKYIFQQKIEIKYEGNIVKNAGIAKVCQEAFESDYIVMFEIEQN
jgi:hypothetical protein